MLCELFLFILIVHMSQGGARVQFLAGHVLYHLYERRYEYLGIRVGSLSPEEGGLSLDVAYGLYHVCLILVDKAGPLLV